MQFNSFLLAIAGLLTPPAFGLQGVATPSPMQLNPFPACARFYQAQPGDTCYSIALSNSLDFYQFLAWNPQIGDATACPANLWAYYWYCIGIASSQGPPPPAQPPASPNTPSVTPSPNSNPPDSPLNSPAPSAPPKFVAGLDTCTQDACRRSIRICPPLATASLHSWCSSFLEGTLCKDADIQNTSGYDSLIFDACTAPSPCQAITSACDCYNDGFNG